MNKDKLIKSIAKKLKSYEFYLHDSKTINGHTLAAITHKGNDLKVKVNDSDVVVLSQTKVDESFEEE